MSIDEIIAALEKAEGPSLALDHEIAAHAKPGDGHGVQIFTSSIDAALTLVPEAGGVWIVGVEPTDTTRFQASLDFGQPICIGATAAIALCIAALKARKP